MRHIFIYVNPESGGRNASHFIKQGVKSLELTKPEPLTLHICSIFEGESGNKPGFIQLRDFLSYEEPQELVFVITAGGDGTLTWVVSEVEKHSINPDLLCFGIIPYGTGNDFARALKWHKFRNLKPFEDNFKPLMTYLNKLMKSDPIKHDFWDVYLKLNPGGSFNKINSKTRLKENLFDSDGNLIESMKFKMGNYFSIGTESRIGRGFDRRRTRYSCFNKFRYILEAFKKTFMGLVYVNNQVERMVYGENEEILFVTDPKEKNLPVLLKSASLVALNIPSFSSGIDAFSLASGIALKNVSEEYKKELLIADQVMGDKKLEFFCYRDMKDVGLDILKFGKSKRLHVGGGPWKIIFKDLSKDEKCYFQVDGEFFVMYQPKLIEIKHYKTINVVK
ncbi:Diacylglycerol kinase accessory domain protein [Theileria parva strain Muguga]|uniref:Diacylglycerol kinase accessory domain protein n=1 Tax=Theileria parva strain Muguga TaxID=333668 RepID=UPI001C61EEEA|nr:Diacylglycerol kinase accessory domain protein [Theileria parva strain Muguga]EAN32758.2 Diacylglycerol kinase accessory domain protein [Theileria parva strain Muguga]